MKTIPFEKVSFAVAKRVHDGAPPKTTRLDWSSRRSTDEPIGPIREETSRWMRELPEGVRPLHLAECFPRIANKVCALWTQPVRCAAHLSDLLIARRIGRQGFPAAVAMEIGNLSIYYAALYPVGRPWAVTN